MLELQKAPGKGKQIKPLQRMMTAIQGGSNKPPVVIPYLQYYFHYVVEKITPFKEADLENGDIQKMADAHSALNDYLDCDWIRVLPHLPLKVRRELIGDKHNAKLVIKAEQLLEEDPHFGLAAELVRRYSKEKFIYGRVFLPYPCLDLYQLGSIEDRLLALKDEPDRVQRTVEAFIPQQIEEVRALSMVGVHGVWLGELFSGADLISNDDYLKFAYPGDKILIDAVRDAGMIDIHHFLGEVMPRLSHVKELSPTCFAVEEPKKNMDLDIGKIRAELGPEMCLMGNIDVYSVVEQAGPEQWAHHVQKQIEAAGPEKFIVSCGSPITPDTPPQKLRDFIRTAKEVSDSFE